MNSRTLFSAATCCLSGLFIGFVTVAPLSAQDALNREAEVLKQAEAEQIKRMEGALSLTTMLDEAAQLVRAKEYTKARARYSAVIEQTSGGGAQAEINSRAKKELAALAALQARQAEAERSYDDARKLWTEAATLDPANPAYKLGLKAVDDKDPPLNRQYKDNSAATPELLEKVTEIQKLLYEGDSLYESGQYQRAIGRYKEILVIDPYHRVARLRIERVEKAKYKAASIRRDARREKALAEVDEAYATKPVIRRQASANIATVGSTQTDVAAIYDKLEKIIIPELNFTEVDVADAISFLRDQSRALDPEKQGVNFVLKAEPTASAAAPAAGGDAAAAPAPAVQRTLRQLNLRQVPLIEVLKLITNLTNLQFKVEEFAVFIFPNTETSEVMVVRSFSVPPNFFSVRPRPRGEQNAIGAETVEFVTADVKQELEAKGVKFPAESSAAYLPRSAKLIVRNTLDQMSLIEQLLSEQSDVTTQIEIETKFLEFTDDKLKELGFNYRIYAGDSLPSNPLSGALTKNNFLGFIPGTNTPVTPMTPPNTGEVVAETNLRDSSDSTAARLLQSNIDALLGSEGTRSSSLFTLSGVIAGSGASMIIRALESQLGADLMSAPKVTVVNGQKTKIRVARELIYPTDYEAPEIEGSSTDEEGDELALPPVVIPSNPSEFETRDVGVTLEVKADATKDRRIDLEIIPVVTEFQGFVNYGGDATTVITADTDLDSLTDLVQRSVVAEGVALTPVFQIRKVETKVQVVDGQTVVMGGFIRDDTAQIKDKIPLLGDLPLVGRFFRTDSTRAIKRNLMIFTTARIMNPDGTPKFLTGGEADALETLSAPALP